MQVTVIEFSGGRKELYYGVQEMSGVPGVVYDVAEDKIEMIRTCSIDRIQETINLICLTSKRVYEISEGTTDGTPSYSS